MTTQLFHLCLLAIASSLLPSASGFSLAPTRISSPKAALIPSSTPILNNVAHTAASSSRLTTTTCLRSEDDKQAEIAALEERLKQLKADGEESSAEAATVSAEMASLTPDELADFTTLEEESDDSIMFSERWKEAKDGYIEKENEKNLGGVAKIAAVVGAIVLLGLFSQVPVGENDLQRYQDIKGNPSRIDLGDLNPDAQ